MIMSETCRGGLPFFPKHPPLGPARLAPVRMDLEDVHGPPGGKEGFSAKRRVGKGLDRLAQDFCIKYPNGSGVWTLRFVHG